MARVLLTWELGGGLGHLVNLKPFAQRLSERGHHVYAALKDVTRADRVLADAKVSFLQAPILTRRLPDHVQRPHTFSQILHHSGFGQRETLGKLTEAWKHIYDYVRPDLIVFDHSPTALLASRAFEVARSLIGTGFFAPTPVYPLPNLRCHLPVDPAILQQYEDRVLDHANALLDQWDRPPLKQISDLYHRVDKNFLATFRELDHYPGRRDGRYVGAWPLGVGEPPRWPSGSGPRIYAYLKPFPALPHLLQTLAELQHPTLIYVDGVQADVLDSHASKNIRFQQQPLELQRVGEQCDLAILNGNHGTTVAMLLAGKPTLQIPLHLEQAVFVGAVERLGAGLRADNDDAETIRCGLREMLGSERFSQGAASFAARYADFDVADQIEAMIGEVEMLLPGAATVGDGRPKTPTQRDPLSLVHHKRFDVMAKYLYAQHREWGIRSSWARRLYLTHIRVFNGFREHVPRKQGPEEFLAAFHDILDSVRTEGFLARHSLVSLGADDVLINGSHRLAACLFYRKPILCRLEAESGTDFSSGWFRRRTQFVSTGLPMACGDPMALQYARLKPDCRMLLVATPTSADEGALLRCVREHGNIVYAKRLELDLQSMQALTRLMQKRRLTGPAEQTRRASWPLELPCGTRDYRVRAFLYEWNEQSDPAELQRHLAMVDDSGGLSIAATCDQATTVELAELVFNHNGVEWLRTIRDLPGDDLDRLLSDLDDFLASRQIARRNVCLLGNAVLAVHGGGGCPRADLLLASPIAEMPSGSQVCFHRRPPDPRYPSADELIADPRWHFYYRGFKFLPLAEKDPEIVPTHCGKLGKPSR